jgi:hypothetical protein
VDIARQHKSSISWHIWLVSKMGTNRQQCICVKRGWRVIQRFRIFIAFAVGDSAWLRKPRSNANTHVVCHARLIWNRT